MEKGSSHDEEMEELMASEVSVLLQLWNLHCIDDSSYGVCDSSQKEKSEAAASQC